MYKRTRYQNNLLIISRITIATILLLTMIFIGVEISYTPSVKAVVVDYTTFTENDVGDYYAVSSSEIVATNYPENAESWIYYDYGADYFGLDFVITGSFMGTAFSGTPIAPIINLCNGTSDKTSADPLIRVYMSWQTGASRIWFNLDDGATDLLDSSFYHSIDTGTRYYYSLTRDSTANTLTFIFDNNSDLSSPVDTIELPSAGTSSFRYLMPCIPLDSANTDTASFVHYALDDGSVGDSVPVLTTNAASSITTTSAYLSGTVSSSTSNCTSWGVQIGVYGEGYTDNYTYTGSQAAPFDFNYTWTSLTPYEHYQYRTFAVNDTGIGYGVMRDFLAADTSALTVGTVTLIPTVESIGIVATYTVDENESSKCKIYYSTDNNTWIEQYTPYADREDKEFRGSCIGLTTNTLYYVKVDYEDAGGVIGTEPVIQTVTTLDENPALGTDKTIFVATDGNDSTGDGSIGNPYLTIAKAATQLVAGTTVYIREGTYEPAATITVSTHGTAAKRITFMPYNSENVTIDGLANACTRIFYITGDYVRISSLTIGNAARDILDWYNADYGIADNCTLYEPSINPNATNYSAVKWKDGSSYCIARDNDIDINHAYPGFSCHGIMWDTAGPGCAAYDNDINGNGCTAARDGFSATPETSSGMSNVDVARNTIVGFYDDDIQIDGRGENTRVWGNKCRTTSNQYSLSVQPITHGPCYVFRNEFARRTKVGDNASNVLFFHNTWYGNVTTVLSLDGTCYITKFVTRNNVASGTNVAYYGDDGYIFASSVSDNCDFDYNDFYNPGSYFGRNDGPYYTLANWQSTFGWDIHSAKNSDHKFTNAGSYDFTLLSDSPDIDQGIELIGYNDANSPWPYKGTAPDLGAHEYDSGSINVTTGICITSAATNILTTSATLNGAVTSSGGATGNVTFVWGTTDGETTLGNWDNSANATYPEQPQGVSSCYYNAIDLPSSTTIYFRLFFTNEAGTAWASTTLSFLTQSSTILAPVNVSATDGTYTDNVTVTWLASDGADGYYILRDSVLLADTGNVTYYADTTAGAAVITPGTVAALDGESTSYVTLVLSDYLVSNGTLYTYTVIAYTGSTNSTQSTPNSGYRGHGVLTAVWYRSSGDADTGYSLITGASGFEYNDTGAPSEGYGRYYKAYLSADGAVSLYSTSDRGYRAVFGILGTPHDMSGMSAAGVAIGIIGMILIILSSLFKVSAAEDDS